MNKTLLLTGAAGFTGRHFIKQAVAAGFDCIALCHQSNDEVDGCCAVVVADLADKQQLKLKLADIEVDYVVHLAAVSFVAHGDIGDIYRSNLLGTVNLLDVLLESGRTLKKVLIASSGNVYGNAIKLPINEQAVPEPVNDYAVSKRAMELAAQVRFERLPITIVRPFNYTGAGQAEHFLIPKIVAAFRRKAQSIELGNLNVARDFSDVRDVVCAYIKLLDSDEHSNIVNICTGKANSLLWVVDNLNKLAGYSIDVRVNPDFVRASEIKQLYGCNQKLKQTIGEYQQYSLEETLAWMYHAPQDFHGC